VRPADDPREGVCGVLRMAGAARSLPPRGDACAEPLKPRELPGSRICPDGEVGCELREFPESRG
jgi:hypothetical protein